MMRLKLIIALNIAFLVQVFHVRGQQDTVISKSLSQRWELDPEDKLGTFRLMSYKPFYFTAARWSDSPNKQPFSENPAYSLDEPSAYNRFEAKFQLSFKTKVLQSFLFGYGDLWVGFTQVAHWQLYNPELSRPFRELNYEPEIMLNFPMKIKLPGISLRMAGVAFNHQSNGQDLPRSRSWNRIIFHLGLERENFQVFIRPWIRLSDQDDENPEIVDYIGKMELSAMYERNGHGFHLLGTNNLSSTDNRGSYQLNYLFPIRANLRGHVQVFTGYGETLIDYNHKQTTLGLGLSFVDW